MSALPESNDPATQEAALWAGELDWIRQHPNPDKSEFEEQWQAELKRSDTAALPPIDIAMWPQETKFRDDISDPKLFNERYIELPTERRANFVDRLFLGLHNMVAVVAILAFITSWDPWIFLSYLVVAAVPAALFYGLTIVPAREGKMGTVRYNRQAQLVHVARSDGVLHYCWKDARPLMIMGFTPGSILRVCYPYPHVLNEIYKLREIKSKKYIEAAGVTVHYLDHTDLYSNLYRLEFLRRYMERGLEAIQPHPEMIEKGLLQPPTADAPEDPWQESQFERWFIRPLSRLWYWFTLGPWPDNLVKKASRNFKWPEEVENLCGPNPDLTGLDTQPVKSRTDIYYRYMGLGDVRFVDKDGHPI